MSFNEKLRELRLQNELSQEKVAIKLDVATRTYNRYEAGTNYPSVEMLTRIATLFNVDISYLMDEKGEAVTVEKAQSSKLGKSSPKQLIKEIGVLFVGDELSETEKDALMEALLGTYWKAKKKIRKIE